MEPRIPAVTLTARSEKRLDQIVYGIGHLKRLEEGAVLVEVLTAELEAAEAKEFIAGTDSKGRSHNKTGKTLKTLKRQVNGLTGYTEMEGGSTYVEFGTPPHDIPNAFGRGFTVHHPGSKEDDFAGRAIKDVEITDDMANMVAVGFLHVLIPDGEDFT